MLVGYYNKERRDWIENNNLYNFRMGSGNGSLVLDKETVSAKYLLLHTKSDKSSGDIWKIIRGGYLSATPFTTTLSELMKNIVK